MSLTSATKRLLNEVMIDSFGIPFEQFETHHSYMIADRLNDYMKAHEPERYKLAEDKKTDVDDSRKVNVVEPQTIIKWYLKSNNPNPSTKDDLSKMLGYKSFGAFKTQHHISDSHEQETIPWQAYLNKLKLAIFSLGYYLTRPLIWLVILVPLALFAIKNELEASREFLYNVFALRIEPNLDKKLPKEENKDESYQLVTNVSETTPKDLNAPEHTESRPAIVIDSRPELPPKKEYVTIKLISDYPFASEESQVWIDGEKAYLSPGSTKRHRIIELLKSRKKHQIYVIYGTDTCDHPIIANQDIELTCF